VFVLWLACERGFGAAREQGRARVHLRHVRCELRQDDRRREGEAARLGLARIAGEEEGGEEMTKGARPEAPLWTPGGKVGQGLGEPHCLPAARLDPPLAPETKPLTQSRAHGHRSPTVGI